MVTAASPTVLESVASSSTSVPSSVPSETPTPTDIPTDTATVSTVPQGLAYLPSCATTPKRGGARKMRREAQALYAYAVEQGGHIDLTKPDVQAELVARGLPPHRLPCAVYDLRSKCGKSVQAIRSGRKVSAYVIPL